MKRTIILLVLVFSLLPASQVYGQLEGVTRQRSCVVCKKEKPTTEFSGKSTTCKACVQKATDEKKRNEQQAAERRRQQQLEQERIAREQAERERIAREQAEKERIAREQAEKERIAREQAEKEREDRDGVDLGLPSGTLWATRNVGATSPEDFGDYFAWGETKGYNLGKRDFSWRTYKWCKGECNKQTKYSTKKRYGAKGFTDNKAILDPHDDVAYMNWGSQWRIPSLDQIKELKEECEWIWTTYKSVTGYLVKGKNGKNIFLPATGYRNNESLLDKNKKGAYWSRSLREEDPYFAYGLDFDSGYIGWFGKGKSSGQSIRPVRMK